MLIILTLLLALAQPGDDPDRLYADRTNLASAERAAAIWEEHLTQNPSDRESAWKLARMCYWLGGHVPQAGRRAQYERGIEAGRRATTLAPNRPEGYFWLAANMGAMADSFGLRQGLKYRVPIRQALEKVNALDPGFQQGSGFRALGRWYQKVPGLFGGSDEKAVELLQRSLTYNSNSTISHYFLAETFLEMNRRAEARAELQRVLDVPLDSQWTPEDLEFKAKAKSLLATLR